MVGSKVGHPQVKICGLTDVDQAAACVSAGADAIGCVFYPPSKRHLSANRARDIGRAVSGNAAVVGVFVDASFKEIMQKVDACLLTVVQLHGQEPSNLVQKLRHAGLVVIKGLYSEGDPNINQAEQYDASAFLVECGRGKLPGGNAMVWDWGAARDFGRRHKLILAGGLTPDNVSRALAAAHPLAVDVSSGVETAPGDKDLNKVAAFIEAVKLSDAMARERSVF